MVKIEDDGKGFDMGRQDEGGAAILWTSSDAANASSYLGGSIASGFASGAYAAQPSHGTTIKLTCRCKAARSRMTGNVKDSGL